MSGSGIPRIYYFLTISYFFVGDYEADIDILLIILGTFSAGAYFNSEF